MLNALARETGRPVSRKDAERIQLVHAEAFANQASSLRVLRGGSEGRGDSQTILLVSILRPVKKDLHNISCSLRPHDQKGEKATC